MEKMQLGSPASPGVNTYLPNFLMGSENNQTPNRNSFSNSPTASPDFPRNSQKLFTGLQSPPTNFNSPLAGSHQQNQQQQFYQTAQNSNASISGPPTTGLFDYLKNEKSFQTPTKNFLNHQQSLNYSQQQQSFHDTSYQNTSGFNQSRIMSPITNNVDAYNNSFQPSNVSLHTTIPSNNNASYAQISNNFWITVFGFPQNAVTAILSHFSQCGSILEKVCSSGNWIHLRFSSRVECDKALLYNGKIICNNIMIGVTRCTDSSILEKENGLGNQQPHDISVSKIRSLTQAGYKSAQEPTDVILSPTAPQRSTGIINKTLDMFFGW